MSGARRTITAGAGWTPFDGDTATVDFEHFQAMGAVIAAVRSGNPTLIRLALAHLDAHPAKVTSFGRAASELRQSMARAAAAFLKQKRKAGRA